MQQRLFEITTLLTARGHVTAKELAERFGVSCRTIYRDIDSLSAAGVPVYCERGRGGGVRLLPGYVLDKSLFSAEEQAQLMAQLQSLVSLDTPGAGLMLEKLSALFGPQESWLEVDFGLWNRADDTHRLFEQLRDAILARRIVRFYYDSATGESRLRDVEPGKIFFRGQGWYLCGFCRTRQDFRFFKFSRIRGLETLGQSFAPRPLPASLWQSESPVPATQITLRIDKHAAFRVYDEFSPEQITPLAGGDFEVQCHFPMGEWTLGYILSFGRNAKVLAPQHLKEQVAAEIAHLAHIYDSTSGGSATKNRESS